MKTTHKLIGGQVGESTARINDYEESIAALGEEYLIEGMIQERLACLASPPGPNDMRALAICVLSEQLRRAKTRLRPIDSEWGSYPGDLS